MEEDRGSKRKNISLDFEGLNLLCFFLDHMSLRLVPSGFAEEDPEEGGRIVRCHHGEKECQANKLTACAIVRSKAAPETYLPLAACLATKYT